MKHELYWQTFDKYPNIKFNQCPSSWKGGGANCSKRTDGQTWRSWQSLFVILSTGLTTVVNNNYMQTIATTCHGLHQTTRGPRQLQSSRSEFTWQAGKKWTSFSCTGATEHTTHTLHNQPATAMLVKSTSIFATSFILVGRDELLSCKSMKLSRKIREAMTKTWFIFKLRELRIHRQTDPSPQKTGGGFSNWCRFPSFWSTTKQRPG